MEKPILFSEVMVQAILEGRKTQTRRIIKPQPLVHNDVIKMPIPIDEYSKLIKKYSKMGYTQIYTKGVLEGMIAPLCKYEVGDVLWVRETWQYVDFCGDDNGYVYRATDPDWETMEEWKWKPSIFMPRAACRIFLKVKSIRAERLQDISEEDSLSEGIIDRKPFGFTAFGIDQSMTAKDSFKYLWTQINGEKSWESNPFVWVVEFEKITI